MLGDVILRAEHISKSFYGNPALKDVQVKLRSGRVHALCGENGAGKSTLLKIITGIYTKDSGEIYFEDRPIEIKDVKTANSYGIYVVPQEMQMLGELTVAENIFIGNYPRTSTGSIDWKRIYRDAEEVKKKLGRHGEKLDIHAKASELGMGDWQLIEIMRALIHDNIRVLAFDEPTSSLSESEAEVLFQLIREFKEKGIAIAYVSHRMKEIYELCDDISVYRDGTYVGTRTVAETKMDELISMMIGRNLDLFGEEKENSARTDEVVLKAEGYTGEKAYTDISLELHKGEILGLYGLVGAGRTEFMRGLFGLDPVKKGKLEINGKPVTIKNPSQAKRLGLGFVTEDRREEGLMLRASLKWNLTMTNLAAISNRAGFLNLKKEREYVRNGMDIFRVKATGSEMLSGGLSGGNQQKIILAKWILADCSILIVDEPTRGIDIGAKAEVYRELKKLASEGKSILMVSSELPEILGISDRIIVMCEGRKTAELENTGLKEEDVIRYAFSS